MDNSSSQQPEGGLLRKYTEGGTSRDWSHVWREKTGGVRGHESSTGPKVRGCHEKESHSNERDLCPDLRLCPVAGYFSWFLLHLLCSIVIPVAWQLQKGINMWISVILDLTLQLLGQYIFQGLCPNGNLRWEKHVSSQNHIFWSFIVFNSALWCLLTLDVYQVRRLFKIQEDSYMYTVIIFPLESITVLEICI